MVDETEQTVGVAAHGVELGGDLGVERCLSSDSRGLRISVTGERMSCEMSMKNFILAS